MSLSFLSNREVAAAGLRCVLMDSTNDLGRVLLVRVSFSTSGGSTVGDAQAPSRASDKDES